MVVNLEYWKAENIFQMHFRRIQSFHFWPEKSYIFFIASLSSLLLVDMGVGGEVIYLFSSTRKESDYKRNDELSRATMQTILMAYQPWKFSKKMQWKSRIFIFYIGGSHLCKWSWRLSWIPSWILLWLVSGMGMSTFINIPLRVGNKEGSSYSSVMETTMDPLPHTHNLTS